MDTWNVYEDMHASDPKQKEDDNEFLHKSYW